MPDINQDNARQMYADLRKEGFTDAGAIGVVGNIGWESGFSTTIRGDGGQAVGYAQWHPDRWGRFLAWINKVGPAAQKLGPYDPYLQEQWVVQEMHDYGIYNDMKNATDPLAASALFMRQFERPADQSNAAAQRREAVGVKIAAGAGSSWAKWALPGLAGLIAGGTDAAQGAVGAVTGAAGAVADKVLGGVQPILWKGLFGALGVGLLGAGVVIAARGRREGLT
jgi:hypothetical protein